MRTILTVALLALAMVGCGQQSNTASNQPPVRIYGSERAALEKAKSVNDTVFQADAIRREQEQRDTQ